MPLAWYPRLLAAPQEQRANGIIVGRGSGTHPPDLAGIAPASRAVEKNLLPFPLYLIVYWR